MLRKSKTNVDRWIEMETPHKREALENASMHFDRDDKLTVNTLEAIYGQESSFGKSRRKRYIDGAAGDFQLERKTAKRMGLMVSAKNDPRFDIDDASAAAAKYLKTLDSNFSKSTSLSKTLKTIPISNASERVKFVIAAYNAGEGRIAKAMLITKKSGGDPNIWDEVKEHLVAAGASAAKAKEIQDYVENVIAYEKEFSEKSDANRRAKYKIPKKIRHAPEGGHWVTIYGRHVFIED